MQLRVTPKVECTKAVFSLKPILQARKEIEIDTHDIFIEVIKAQNSVKHDIILLTLLKIGAPEEYIKQIEKLYNNFNVMLKIGRKVVRNRYRCRVQQSDNLALMLFIITI